MKKNDTQRGILLSFLLLTLSNLIVQAQAPRSWLTPESREINYPCDSYYWEIMPGNLKSGETATELLERLKTDAKSGAVAKIQTNVQGFVQKSDWQVSVGENYDFTTEYNAYSTQSWEAEIVGFKTETFYDESKKIGYAFAYVKKSELATYYKSQVNLKLQQAQTAISNAKVAAKSGLKMRAKKVCEDAMQPLTQAKIAQHLLSAVFPNDTQGLQTVNIAKVEAELMQMLTDLEQSIYVYLNCTESNMGLSIKELEPTLKQILATHHCSFASEENQADYLLTVKASTRKHEGNITYGGTMKFAYADVSVSLYSNFKKMEIYENKLSVKNNGNGITYESAGINALNLSAQKIWEAIRPWIEK